MEFAVTMQREGLDRVQILTGRTQKESEGIVERKPTYSIFVCVAMPVRDDGDST